MKFLALIGLALILAATAGAQSGGIVLTKTAEDETTLTLSWEPVPGSYGYRFFRDEVGISHTWDGSRSSVRFDKGAKTYSVVSLSEGPKGSYSPPVPGTTLTFHNTFWRCTQPLASYGALPITVVMTYDRPFVPSTGGGAVQIGQGCSGDGSSATDLILDVRGDGRTYGPGEDAVRIMNVGDGARNIEIEGHADCGPRQGAAHQDGIQILGGLNITFRNFTIGNYEAGMSTCQGAGGALFYSLPSQNVRAEGGSYIGCNHSLLASAQSGATGVVSDASFRSGRVDGSDPVCATYSSSDPCIAGSLTVSNLTCERWNGTAWVRQG